MARSIVLSGIVLSLGLLSGCATTGTVGSSPPVAAPPAQVAARQAIRAARSAYVDARAKGFAWTGTAPLIFRAEQAYRAGYYRETGMLAGEALLQAQASLNQYYYNRGSYNLGMLGGMADIMTSAQRDQLNRAAELYLEYRGLPLYTLTVKLLGELNTTSRGEIMVRPGETLWSIAARTSVYGNPYEWPLIYKANKGRIDDPFRLTPGQVLAIIRSPSQSMIKAAIDEARHWTAHPQPDDSAGSLSGL